MSESSGDEPLHKRKRGVVNEKTYKRNTIRNARVQGEGYVSYSGKEVPQKTKPDIITCKCNVKCYLNINNEVINDTWRYFHSLENKNSQDTYIQTLVEVNAVKRRRKKQGPEQDVDNANDNEGSFKRAHSYHYNLRIGGVLKHVCKNVFMKIHGISHNRLGRICQLLLQNTTPIDMRGQNRSGNAVSGNICVRIHDHIAKFEVKETHYGGKHKKYLDARLNVTKLHEMFINDNPDLKDLVKYHFYYSYFHENFGYSFGRPQVDVCSQCESLKSKLRDQALNDNAKRTAAAELMIHKRRAKKFYTCMQEASKNDDKETAALCFDYMQNLPLPNIPVQEIFYMRQLWVNVFSIHDLTSNKSKIYLYHEGEGNKSPDEVCSFLLNYIETEIPNTVKNMILFSDGPSGQNKNHTVVRFLMNLCDKGRFDSITHNFPVRGHSYSPCDRDFGAIKRLLKRVDRIYTPEEYMELILKASKTNRFTIHRVTSQDIRSFKTWWPHSYKKLTNSDETSGRGVPKDQKEIFKISTYKQFCYNKNTPGKVIVKPYINGFIQSTFTLRKTDVTPDLPTQMAYPSAKVSF